MQSDHQGALGNLIAQRNVYAQHGAADAGRHVHGRLVGFDDDQRIVGADLITRRNADLDHLDLIDVTDVWNPYFLIQSSIPAFSTRTASPPPPIRSFSGWLCPARYPAHRVL